LILGADARRDLQMRLTDLVGWQPSDGDEGRAFAALYETLDDPSFPGAVIPRVRNREMLLYAVADSGQSWRRLQPLVMAFAGVTLSHFDGRAVELDAADPIEALFLESGISHAARMVPPQSEAGERDLLASLVRLRQAVGRAPVLSDEVSKTTTQLLGDFRLSLAVRDRGSAEAVIETLRGEMRLDALNLLFLQVQLDAALEDWVALRKRDYFESLCLTRRPPRVTAALAEALFHELIEPIEIDGRAPLEVLDTFRGDVLGRFGSLFVACPPAPTPAVAKMFLLATLAAPTTDVRLVERLSAEANTWDSDAKQSFDRLLRLRPLTEMGTPVEAPPRDANSELESLNELESPSIADARAVLVAASIVQTLDAYRIGVDVVSRLSDADQRDLLRPPGVRAMWEEVHAHSVVTRVPRGWAELVRLVPELSFGVLRAWAEKGVTEYPLGRELPGQEAVRSFVADLQTAFVAAEEVTHQLLPYVVEWVRADDLWPNPEYRALYQEILDLLLLGSGRTATAVRAVGELLAALLSVGIDPATYKRTLSDLLDWLSTALGVPTADAVIDVVDLLATYPSPDPATRQTLWVSVAGGLSRLWPRLSIAQQSVIVDVAAVLETPGIPAFGVPQRPMPDSVPLGPGRGYLVAIYTLMEGAGLRVQRALERANPGIRVELSSSHVADAKLNEMAGRADLFVVCWASAKHAATIAIRNRRPKDRPTLFPRGVGSTSVVREVQDYLATVVA
jgi:hypothetical protein